MPARKVGEINPDILAGSEFVNNTSNIFIQTTEDKVRLALHEHQACLESRWLWLAPVGIALSVLLTLKTVDIPDSNRLFGIPTRAAFLGVLIASAVFSAITILRAIKAWKSGGVEQVIRALKGKKESDRP